MKLPKDLQASIIADQLPLGTPVYHVTVTISKKKYTYDVYGLTPLDAVSVLSQALNDGYGAGWVDVIPDNMEEVPEEIPVVIQPPVEPQPEPKPVQEV